MKMENDLKKYFILNFTPTGMIPTRSMTPHVPISPDEIIKDVNAVASLGVNMVHLHARDPQTGEPTYKKEIYEKIIAGIRAENPELIICVSTSGRTFGEFWQRSECLDITGDLKPDFGSLTLSSLNFNELASINAPDMIKKLALKMTEKGIKPEMEVFDLGMINYAKYLIRKGIITPPYYLNFILGNIACAQADLLHLGLLIKELPERAYWSVGAIGNSQFKMNLLSLIAGGGVRIGLEDNIWFDEQRTKLATNTDYVERILHVAQMLGYEPYPPETLRKVLDVKRETRS